MIPSNRDFNRDSGYADVDSLRDTYKDLVSCESHFFSSLDEKELATCEKIASYFADKKVGIHLHRSDVSWINAKIIQFNSGFNEESEFQEQSKLHKRAQAVYEKLHPHEIIYDLPAETLSDLPTGTPEKTNDPMEITQNLTITDIPREVRELIFNELGIQDLLHISETSKQLRDEIFANNNIIVLKVLYKALTIAKQIQNPNNKVQALNDLAEQYALLGYFKEAIAIINHIENSSAHDKTLHFIFERQIKLRLIKDALETTTLFHNPNYKLHTRIKVAEFQAENGQKNFDLKSLHPTHQEQAKKNIAKAAAKYSAENALQFMKFISDPKDRDEVSIEVLKNLAEKGDYPAANKILDSITDPKLKDVANSEFVKILAKKVDYTTINKLINSIVDPNLKNKTRIDYIYVLIENNSFRTAEEEIDNLNLEELDPEDIDFLDNDLAKDDLLCSLARSFAKALEFKEAHRVAEKIQDPFYNVSALAHMISLQALSSDIEEAQNNMKILLSMFERIAEDFLEENDYIFEYERQKDASHDIAHAQAACGLVDQALESVNRMDYRDQIETLSIIAESLANNLKFKDAIRIASAIDDQLERDKVLFKIIERLIVEKDFFGAVEIIELIGDHGIKAQAKAIIARFQAQNGDYKGANETLASAIALAEAQDNPFEKVKTLIKITNP